MNIFHISKLNSVTKNPNKWITQLKLLHIKINQMPILNEKLSNQAHMIYILMLVPKEYNIMLDGLENRICLADGNPKKLTVEDIQGKLRNPYNI